MKTNQKPAIAPAPQPAAQAPQGMDPEDLKKRFEISTYLRQAENAVDGLHTLYVMAQNTIGEMHKAHQAVIADKDKEISILRAALAKKGGKA